jgi:hypothetical protein
LCQAHGACNAACQVDERLTHLCGKVLQHTIFADAMLLAQLRTATAAVQQQQQPTEGRAQTFNLQKAGRFVIVLFGRAGGCLMLTFFQNSLPT